MFFSAAGLLKNFLLSENPVVSLSSLYLSFIIKWANLTILFNRLEFVLENGNLKHTKSGKCVQPIGAASDGVVLGLYSSCGGHQFSFTAGGSLQHVGSKKCVNTKSGVSRVKFLEKKDFWNNILFFYCDTRNKPTRYCNNSFSCAVL